MVLKRARGARLGTAERASANAACRARVRCGGPLGPAPNIEHEDDGGEDAHSCLRRAWQRRS
eukprot:609343-Alexandrium_andersonii.AAC.1